MKELQINIELDENRRDTSILIQTNQLATGNQLLTYLGNFEIPEKKLIIKQADKYIWLTHEEIIYCEVYQKILTIYTLTEQYQTRQSF